MMLTTYDVPLINRVRYVVALLGYVANSGREIGSRNHLVRDFLSTLAKKDTEQLPDIRNKDNPWLCVYCGKQVGNHFGCAIMQIPYWPTSCCDANAENRKITALGGVPSELFWKRERSSIVCEVSIYMKVPAYLVWHCMTLELQEFVNHRINQNAKPNRVAVETGFDFISSLE